MRPLEKALPGDDTPWYSAVPLGMLTLQQKVKKLCANAGVVGHKTNHSLRASSATAMYNAGIPEKLIQERTGHRSLDALRTYERSNDQQQKEAVSSILSVPQEQKYHRKARKTLDLYASKLWKLKLLIKHNDRD